MLATAGVGTLATGITAFQTIGNPVQLPSIFANDTNPETKTEEVVEQKNPTTNQAAAKEIPLEEMSTDQILKNMKNTTTTYLGECKDLDLTKMQITKKAGKTGKPDDNMLVAIKNGQEFKKDVMNQDLNINVKLVGDDNDIAIITYGDAKKFNTENKEECLHGGGGGGVPPRGVIPGKPLLGNPGNPGDITINRDGNGGYTFNVPTFGGGLNRQPIPQTGNVFIPGGQNGGGIVVQNPGNRGGGLTTASTGGGDDTLGKVAVGLGAFNALLNIFDLFDDDGSKVTNVTNLFTEEQAGDILNVIGDQIDINELAKLVNDKSVSITELGDIISNNIDARETLVQIFGDDITDLVNNIDNSVTNNTDNSITNNIDNSTTINKKIIINKPWTDIPGDDPTNPPGDNPGGDDPKTTPEPGTLLALVTIGALGAANKMKGGKQ
ncbi:MAG: hypothetical protein HRT47_03030 [Candidatus Caenarcaniphilales bacterium]|nr:hypothetical protein [Candidatus Caenarcaniphilales bacterium]